MGDGGIFAIAFYNGLPGQRIQCIDQEPHANNRYQPVAGMAQVLPQFDETDVKRKQHHHHSRHAYDEEQIVESLLSPGHALQFIGNTLTE